MVRHRFTMIEPTSLKRETDAAFMPVHSLIVRDLPEAAASKKSPTCLRRFNYDVGTAIADFPQASFFLSQVTSEG